MFPTQAQPSALSVSELNRQAKHLLEVSFSRVWVVGELSGFSRPASGHWYFSLKDDKALVRCVMFKNRNQLIRTPPKNGDLIMIDAKVSLYEGRGDYQLIVNALQLAGSGSLQQQFEQLKAKLQKEGLFDEAIKRPLPPAPKNIGIVTSQTGAAIHDILSVSQRRFPATKLFLYPTQVQGESAATDIVNAITLANLHGKCDVLIVGRGGGSLEDLWPFNEEKVARAIRASAIPVVSAVGHEVDFTIADFVSDWRAPTPSAAAELLTPDQQTLWQRLDILESAINRAVQKNLNQANRQLDSMKGRLKTPQRVLSEKKTQVQDKFYRLSLQTRSVLQTYQRRLDQLATRIHSQAPHKKLQQHQRSLTEHQERLDRAIKKLMKEKQSLLGHQVNQLNTLSPLNTVARGYSILSNGQNEVVHRTEQINQGEVLTARLVGGTAQLEVKAVNPQQDPASNI